MLEVKSRGGEFARGAILPLPIFVGLVLLTWSVVNPTMWTAIGATGDLPLEVLFASCLLTVVGLVALTLRFWKRSRWFAYGILTSFIAALLAGVALALLLMIAIGSAIKG